MHKTKIYYYEQLKKCIEDKGGKLISTTYTLSKDKYEYECVSGHICKATGYNIKRGQGCKKCSKYSPEHGERTFRETVTLKGGTVIGDYINSDTPVLTDCGKGHQWWPRPGDVKSGHWCRKCAGLCPEQAAESLAELVDSKGGQILEVYTNNKAKMLVECDVGHRFRMRLNDIKDGHWCQRCANCSPEQVRENVEKIVKNQGGIILTSYVNSGTKMELQCDKQHRFKITPTSIQKMHWCNVCGESSLEREARLFLEFNNIKYSVQYEISQLPRKRYDFYFEYNGFKILLEIDGDQHFMYKSLFHKSNDGFIYKQHIDRLKTRAAIEFGYQIIRVDFSQIHNVGYHIIQALQQNQPAYLSSPDKYMFLYDNVPTEIVRKHSPDLAIKFNL
jgi:very-short-patch-repair endonuclease